MLKNVIIFRIPRDVRKQGREVKKAYIRARSIELRSNGFFTVDKKHFGIK